ncbi:molybdate ABC transporter substrate-binding protein [Cognatiyoonia sp. IB215182]|uniref:molybdate ABC transporter substrate-binding protein n=1 Tax=Cognatiyoonia sp. IB215182 TaxID=3097353 RepID=UPI002A173CD4|nr:molybdate ABC transporter substrate-binding protein [Cognatiyoonia sp. IB215182]MDX8355455.1 molybdate ABC transporter substrate-binding protein [Cognatiyoonia sp. IB215182]
MKWVALASILACLASLTAAETVVMAAASTNRAITAAIDDSGIEAVSSFAASGVLARQIEQGAPADIFVSANPKWMSHLVENGVIAEDAVRLLMSNSLVLIAPTDAPKWTDVTLEARLSGEVFAMADPAVAPVGAYGKEALENLGLWGSVQGHLVPMHNTLATVAAVSTGDAAIGLVYASDAIGQPVQVLWSIPQESHPEIRYLIAPIGQGSDASAANALLSYLDSDAGRTVLAANGFLIGQGN